MSFPTFTARSTADEVAAAFAEQISGKTVLITGTSVTGLGFSSARAMAKYAGLLIITGRRPHKIQEAVDAIKAEYPSANVRPLTLDLGSFASVRKAAAEINAYPEPLHVLIHNAAAEMGPFVLSEDKLESQFASDHVGPFLFTKLLAPKLLASSARVVVVSSGAHAQGTIDWATLAAPDASTYHPLAGYAQAKLANVLFAKALTARSGGRIQAFSLHPGAIDTSSAAGGETFKTLQAVGIFTPEGKPNMEMVQWKTLAEGGATTIAAAFDPRIEGKGGAYLEDSAIMEQGINPAALDPANADKLWTVTEEIVGEKFTF
uniref:Short-chain dehydrogenase/reductase family protein n=1 Tax=Mycena chlorophos TaxID=658473 RepID=A0ABQ0L9G7_MYCCL|nr:short-chain dehydrogenase/reductase family protein [Mycena chlorophos]